MQKLVTLNRRRILWTHEGDELSALLIINQPTVRKKFMLRATDVAKSSEMGQNKATLKIGVPHTMFKDGTFIFGFNR